MTSVPETDRALWLDRVGALRQWRQHGERAPHKPLLLLYALGRLRTNGPNPISFASAEPKLAALLDEFGPPRKTTAAYPFRRLANDDSLWIVETPTGEEPGESPARLRDLAATGRLDESFARALEQDPGLLILIARYLLEDNWPPSLHDEIATAVGLDLDTEEVTLVRKRLADVVRRRDPGFRERVLMAYEYQCAICGFDGRLDNAVVGLDAAHVRWWSDEGPDSVDNGTCLCNLHHVLFDKGVLGVTSEHEITVSKRFVGRSATARALVLDLVGRPIIEPLAGESPIATEHLEWHTAQVFRPPARQP